MRIIVFILFFSLFLSCKNQPEERKITGTGISEIESSILQVNRYILKRNRDHIHGFLKRTGWNMKMTGSGLFYEIEEEGTGENVKNGDRISLYYRLRLIDGSFIDSSDDSGPMEFTAGQGGVPVGLEEAVLLLRKGTKARLILPPHLAYGNFGDAEIGVPPDAILFYEIYLNWIK